MKSKVSLRNFISAQKRREFLEDVCGKLRD